MGNWSKNLDELAKNDKVLYILTGTDIPFVQDGTRDGEHLRSWMHRLFLKELKKHNKNYIVVSGDRKTRLQKAIDVIDTIR